MRNILANLGMEILNSELGDSMLKRMSHYEFRTHEI